MKSEILVIDDNVDIRFLICNILQENGHEVRSAANYEQAVKEIKKLVKIIVITYIFFIFKLSAYQLKNLAYIRD